MIQRVAAIFGEDEALNAGANGRVEESALVAQKGVIQGGDDDILTF